MNYDKNSKKIIIPEGVSYIPENSFRDFKELEEVILPSTITHIGMGAFAGCSSLKKINLPEDLKIVDAFSFMGCSSLEEITFPKSLHYIDTGVFSSCINLKTLNLHDEITYIENFGLHDCHSLENFALPKNISSLGEMALSGCDSIKSIYIPSSLTSIEKGALSLMHSLEEIIVDSDNPKYVDDENIALIEKENGLLIQYAINSKKDEFQIGYYLIDEFGSYEPVYNIADFAFAGSKYLKALEIPSVCESFGPNTFLDCSNLKRLNIYHCNYGNVLLFNAFGFSPREVSSPFEEIFLEDGITTISDNINTIFKNATSVSLPSTLIQIGSNIFSSSKNLSSLMLPKGIKMISPSTFYDDTDLIFEDMGSLKAKDFNRLETKTSNNHYFQTMEKDNIKRFSLSDGTYYVKVDDLEMVKVNRKEIRALSTTSFLLEDTPDIFVQYIHKLLSVNQEYPHILNSVLHNENLKNKFLKFASDMDYNKNINKVIREILEEHYLNEDVLFNGILMQKLSTKDIITIISNMTKSLERFLKFSLSSIEVSITKYDNHLDKLVTNIPSIISYCNILEKYGHYDRFLYNPRFVLSLSNEEQELLISHYNSNLKRFLINSGVLELNNYDDVDLSDLIKFGDIIGVFSDDEIISQKACSFITEKIFLNEDDNYRIVGDNIHRIFNEIEVRNELDLEFILFFVENYKELISIEKTTSGFISRVYNAFREISKTSSSNKGEQRHLKVTVNKCKDYFLMNKFGEYLDDDNELVSLLGQYFSSVDTLKAAKLILEEAKSAPRNIFTDDNNPDLDLHGRLDNGFYYEWLPKQSLDNLVLGKYCSCCSHVEGAGAGIMRASMTLDNCQNLVIRNDLGDIIAKATLYVDKDNGYGVFNTIEGNLHYRSKKQLNKIYDSFMAGSKAFIDTYNSNNPDRKIDTIVVGNKRNILSDFFDKGMVTPPLPVINYSTFNFVIGDKIVGKYAGDAANEQKYVLTKNKK